MLNSRCSLKSVNFSPLMMSTQGTLLVSVPFAAAQQLPLSLLRSFQPVRSLPLNRWIGLPHFGGVVRVNSADRTPSQFNVFPSAPSVVPSSRLTFNRPLKTRSLEFGSYCTGTLKTSSPFL